MTYGYCTWSRRCFFVDLGLILHARDCTFNNKPSISTPSETKDNHGDSIVSSSDIINQVAAVLLYCDRENEYVIFVLVAPYLLHRRSWRPMRECHKSRKTSLLPTTCVISRRRQTRRNITATQLLNGPVKMSVWRAAEPGALASQSCRNVKPPHPSRDAFAVRMMPPRRDRPLDERGSTGSRGEQPLPHQTHLDLSSLQAMPCGHCSCLFGRLRSDVGLV